jgi:hypothetical protein
MGKQDANPATGRPRRPRRKWVIAACVLLIPVIGFLFFRQGSRTQAHEELARIRAEGYPVTPEELDAWYVRPQGANAADVYL